MKRNQSIVAGVCLLSASCFFLIFKSSEKQYATNPSEKSQVMKSQAEVGNIVAPRAANALNCESVIHASSNLKSSHSAFDSSELATYKSYSADSLNQLRLAGDPLASLALAARERYVGEDPDFRWCVSDDGDKRKRYLQLMKEGYVNGVDDALRKASYELFVCTKAVYGKKDLMTIEDEPAIHDALLWFAVADNLGTYKIGSDGDMDFGDFANRLRWFSNIPDRELKNIWDEATSFTEMLQTERASRGLPKQATTADVHAMLQRCSGNGKQSTQ